LTSLAAAASSTLRYLSKASGALLSDIKGNSLIISTASSYRIRRGNSVVGICLRLDDLIRQIDVPGIRVASQANKCSCGDITSTEKGRAGAVDMFNITTLSPEKALF
jgi:hypothetical protein